MSLYKKIVAHDFRYDPRICFGPPLQLAKFGHGVFFCTFYICSYNFIYTVILLHVSALKGPPQGVLIHCVSRVNKILVQV